MPVTPATFKLRYRGKNERTALINGGEMTHIRHGEHAQIGFELSLPRKRYPFARYERGFVQPERFLEHFLHLREARRPFRFILSRQAQSGILLANTNMRVTLESFDVVESAKDGDDLLVSMNLREFREFATKRIDENKMVQRPAREADEPPFEATHTVVRGDNLWNLARRYLGSGQRYPEIFALNRDQIQHPNLIFPGQVLRLPAG